MRYQIGIDIGGTFTDCAVMDEAGEMVTIAKSPTHRVNPERGVLNVLTLAAENLGMSRSELLTRCRFLIHGCTVATNTMVERNGAPSALFTTKGHEDAIFVGKVIQKAAGLSEQEIIHQSRLNKARPPLIERVAVEGITERIDSEGEVVVPLSHEEVDAALDRIWAKGIRSLAVSFLWSFQNDRHEQWVKQRVAERYPDLFLTLSSEICPVLGEYERTVTTLANAYVGPKVIGYMTRLKSDLEREGYRAPLLLAHCVGGLTTLEEVREKPILTLDSGPVSGVLGARYFGKIYGEPNIICTDVGGTTFDVSLVHDGETVLDEEPIIDQYHYLIPKIAVKSIGAGGGSIIWHDADGLIRVGPKSAGSDPGPACYGAGGEEATVTDANVLLGYLNPENFLGGAQRLDRSLAEAAMARLGERVNMDTLSVAAGAFRIVNAQMADLVRQASIDRGYDPRKFALFSYGGAGPIHIAFIARELRLKRVYIPSFATVFSAMGMLTGGILHTAERAFLASFPINPEQSQQLAETFFALTRQIDALFDREGVEADRRSIQCSLYLKYRMQPTALLVEINGPPSAIGDGRSLTEAFEQRYKSIYGENAAFANAGYEIVKCRVDGVADATLPSIKEEAVAGVIAPEAARAGSRLAYFEETRDLVPTPIYRGERLTPGMRVTGPAIIERMGDTVVLPPNAEAEVDGYQNLVLEVRREGEVR